MLALAIACAAVAAACADRRSAGAQALPPANDPREAALALFQAAQTGRSAPEELASLLGDPLPPERRSSLAVVLAPLRTTADARVVAHEALGPDRAAVDIEVRLPGGGSARYSAETERREDGRWIVAAIHGPGAAWPLSPIPSGEGLSTSSPPATGPAPSR